MSLLDGLLLDALLQNIVRSVVYVALREDLKNDPDILGAGTIDDPYDGSKTSGGVYKFDKVMRDKVAANTTVRLGPGIFPTKGYKSDGSVWAAKSGVRIVGGGWAGPNANGNGVTILKLEGHSGASNVAVRCGLAAGDVLAGFELTLVTIDCGLPDTVGVAAKAVDVTGTHICIHHIRAINFGGKGTACDVITAARVSEAQPTAIDCVISDCVIESPSGFSTGAVACLRLKSTPTNNVGHYHTSCVLRNNVVDCGTNGHTYDFRGIVANGGIGIIVEQNRIWNCKAGFYSTENVPTKDLIVRDNYFYNVIKGIEFYLDDGLAFKVGRLCILGNFIELPTGGSPTGIEIGDEGNTILQLVIRQNEIRHLDGAAGTSTAIGITVDTPVNAIIEENLINIGTSPTTPSFTKAITYDGGTIKTFNNQSTSGYFIPAAHATTGLQKPDLVKEAENWWLAM